MNVLTRGPIWSRCVVAALCLACAVPLQGGGTAAPVEDRAPAPTGAVGGVAGRELPPGFSDSVLGEVPFATALAFTPDGRMLVTAKPGRLMVLREGGSPTVALDLAGRVCDDGERGLVGVAVDPGFEENHFVYLYYTHAARGSCGPPGRVPSNRVSRFVLGDDDTVSRRSEHRIVDHIVSPKAGHIAGDLEFAADGYLYVTVGDGRCSLGGRRRCGGLNDNSQRLRYPHGKVLRVTRGGRPAPDNPYADRRDARRCTRPSGAEPGSGPCMEIFALGLRNPYRFARRPGTSRFFVNDVGMKTWEEVDRLRKGRNYGWNVREGKCRRESTTRCGAVPGFTNPIFHYGHGRCRSITGGAFVPVGVWPGYDDSYLFADFACGTIFQLRKVEGEWGTTPFMGGADGPVHLRFGPHGDTQALYYLSFFSGTIHRIARSTVNTRPVAEFAYTPDGATVSFSGNRSSDPDAGDSVVRWSWSFGDGTSSVTTTPTTMHTFAAERPYDVTLVVTDARGARSVPFTRTVHAGEHAPDLTLTEPSPDVRYAVGSRVTLAAQAHDAEDGTLPGSAITWSVRLRHANHFHPYLGPVTGRTVTTTYPAPEYIAAARTSRLVVTVTATDARGHTTSVRQRLLPRRVVLSFSTAPRGGVVVLDGERRRTPLRVSSWERYALQVRAPDQRIDGARRTFVRWSDGGRRSHAIVTPSEPTRFRAFYR
jgi:glucose/arabinose dehydrogenase